MTEDTMSAALARYMRKPIKGRYRPKWRADKVRSSAIWFPRSRGLRLGLVYSVPSRRPTWARRAWLDRLDQRRTNRNRRFKRLRTP